ncbi:5-deoxy-glucuronate isomerase [Pelagibacterium xiamenense]|uniref:5-deoxy-glucuronate isomerase n=1 Tax=Pelagibacterium xiamenense TaxID=2901140 RepID=UPI001E64E4CD|nr:5-deoxy-glucuronate isomerase [Pelagibacterium xiamenense]MCD7060199.1 5-deoxy-glucuronate isomerase [Pelagibacterium xiamenense]
MAELLVKPTGETGQVISVTPQNAGWTYVGFDLHKLTSGKVVSGETGSREVCLVFVAGKGNVVANGEALGELGERMSPFDGKPHSVYLPGGSRWSVEATTDLELAVCSAPDTTGSKTARVIAPDGLGQETRGKGTNIRYVTNILPETDDTADSLLVVEVITPGGHTSSYPPHKHDEDNLPAESALEETYYHRLNPPQGYAFQRVYTDDRTLDETMLVEDGVVTLVPKGYHPCAAIHGYDLYYLNVMAGPKRIWRFHNQKEHEWLLNA